jgi:hypothetical protein
VSGQGTYLVTVLRNDPPAYAVGKSAIDKEAFPFGEFKEIGYWLDDKGYNDARYRVMIDFTEGTLNG